MSYVKIGNGPKPMMMLPGIALRCTLLAKDLVAQHFTQFSDYTIYLMDDRHQVKEGYTIEKRADDVAAIMTELGLSQAYVYGASMGGMVAQQLAIRHPELVKKAVLAATSAKLNENAREILGKWCDMACQETLSDLIKLMNRQIYSPNTIAQFADVLDNIVGPVSDEELALFKLLGDAVLMHDATAHLGEINCEVLVVGALGDQVLGSEASEALHQGIKGSQLLMYGTEFGHGVFDEAPDFRDKMLAFFEA